MLVAVLSAKGSPGVTTAALALSAVWARPAVMLDADPFGGDVRAGVGRGTWPADAGIADLVVDLRTTTLEQSLFRHIHRPGKHVPPVVAGIASIAQAKGVPWSTVAPGLAGVGTDVIADCGRFVPGVLDDLLRASDAILMICGSTLRDARAVARAVPLVQALGEVSGLVVSRPGHPYGAAEIADSCGLPLLGKLPDDPRTAAVWSEGHPPGRTLFHTAYMQAARQISDAMIALPARRRTA